MEHRLDFELDREMDEQPHWWDLLLPETPARYCGCGNELTLAERERGEEVCGECR